jgi:hypothetical protein
MKTVRRDGIIILASRFWILLYLCNESLDISGSKVSGYVLEDWESIPDRGRNFSCHRVQSNAGAHLASYPQVLKSTFLKISDWSTKLITHLHLVWNSTCMTSWCAARLKCSICDTYAFLTDRAMTPANYKMNITDCCAHWWYVDINVWYY